jgi:hypothetical protein
MTGERKVGPRCQGQDTAGVCGKRTCGKRTCVKSGSHKGTEGKGGVHEEFSKAGEALIEDEALMGTAASKGRWREARRKQSVTLMGTVRFRSCSEDWNSWSQVGGVEGW